jgi:outer membrane lipoprotein SlyB
MLKVPHLAVASVALALGACASDPVAYNEPVYVAQSSGTYVRDVAPAEVGHVSAIDVVRGGGHSSGGGAVIGAIVGGVLGHQVGSGRGNDAATVAGAVGGAVAGNEIEKRRNDDEVYRIVVRLRDGREASFTQDSLGGLRVGDRVRIVDNRLYRD